MGRDETNSELVERLDALLLSVRERIDERLPDTRDDIVNADELYVFAGHVEASLRAALEHAAGVRESLVRKSRGSE